MSANNAIASSTHAAISDSNFYSSNGPQSSSSPLVAVAIDEETPAPSKKPTDSKNTTSSPKPRPLSARTSLKPKVPRLSRNHTSSSPGDNWDNKVYHFLSPYDTGYHTDMVTNNLRPPLSIYDQRREFVTSYVKIYNEAENSKKTTVISDNDTSMTVHKCVVCRCD